MQAENVDCCTFGLAFVHLRYPRTRQKWGETLMIGQKLGNRYEIQKLLGEGATAIVYQGVDTLLQRTVAIKVLLPYVDKTTRKRFQREAQAAAQLNHPNIMSIYDVGEDEQPYLIVEYIEGRPLFDFIPSPPEQVAAIGQQICEALDYAHRQHLIHRDIKPANIYITPAGQIKIMDFGLAITGASKRVTATGRVIGTPAYLSPEQAQGQPLTYHTDIYSTGIVLYEMATGVLPFDTNDIGILLLQQVKKPPKPPRELVPEIPPELERIILKALEKHPAARFQTAGEMAQALAAISGQAIELPPNPNAHTADPSARTQTQSPPSAALRVVLADDHRILRRSLAMFLTTEGIEVVGEANNGAQALALVQEQHPDVLLLDLDMPGTSGLDVLPQIRQAQPDVKVLVLTGQTEDRAIMRALRAGAHGYILKTTEETALVQAVHDVLKGHMVLGHGVAERVAQQYVAHQEADETPYSELERTVLVGMAAGLSNDQIAKHLHLAPPIVDRQVIDLLERLTASSRTEAAMQALRQGIISLNDVHGFSP